VSQSCRHNPLCCFSTSVCYCFVMDSLRKLLDTPSHCLTACYVTTRYQLKRRRDEMWKWEECITSFQITSKCSGGNDKEI